MPQSKAGYIDARPLTANSTKTSCDARPDHTFGSFTTFAHFWHVRFTPKATPGGGSKSDANGMDRPCSCPQRPAESGWGAFEEHEEHMP